MSEIVVSAGILIATLLAMVSFLYAKAAHGRAETLEKILRKVAARTVIDNHWDDDNLYIDDALRRLLRKLGYTFNYNESHYTLEKKEAT